MCYVCMRTIPLIRLCPLCSFSDTALRHAGLINPRDSFRTMMPMTKCIQLYILVYLRPVGSKSISDPLFPAPACCCHCICLKIWLMGLQFPMKLAVCITVVEIMSSVALKSSWWVVRWSFYLFTGRYSYFVRLGLLTLERPLVTLFATCFNG